MKLSPKRASWPVLERLPLRGRGKVRDTYDLHDQRLLSVATDGISALDYVINELIPFKGAALTAMTIFWLRYLEQFGITHHMIACGAGIDKYLPHHLRGDFDRQIRAIVVKLLQMFDKEFVVRGNLTGSGLGSYNKDGSICGCRLPKGLQDGDELPYTMFTPTTKAQEGHDENVSALSVIVQHPEASALTIQIYEIAKSYAKARGILIADTKLEFGLYRRNNVNLGDEVLTPDSSRFWPYSGWLIGQAISSDRKSPGSFDKEPVRTWLKAEIKKFVQENPAFIDRLKIKYQNFKGFDPKYPECEEVVHSFKMPEALKKATTQAYRYILWRLVGKIIENFWREDMGILVPAMPQKKVLIICGSESDLPDVNIAQELAGPKAEITRHVISCHRNPDELRNIIRDLNGFDVLIGVGSKALALPGKMDAWAHHFKKGVPVAGVALGATGSQDLFDAQRSIAGLPSEPVIMDEITGRVYSGREGLIRLFDRIDNGELPPPKPRKEKPALFNV